MGDWKPEQVFVTQSLSGSSYILNRNTLIHNLITMPLHQSNGNPTHLPNNSINQSSTSVKSSTDDAVKKGGLKAYKYLPSFVAGTAVAPLERVYTLMQCQNGLVSTGRISSPYKGMKDCFLRTIRHEGFFSLWRGNSVNVYTMCGLQAAAFLGPKEEDLHSSIMSDVPAGVFAAIIMVSSVFIYPVQYAQARLINDVTRVSGIQFTLDSTAKTMTNNAAHRQFSSALDVIKKTLMSDGFGGLYRGYTIFCLGSFAYVKAYRAIAESYQTYTKEKPSQMQTFWAEMAPPYMMAVAIPVALYPIGTVSKRMMITSGEVNKYKGPVDALIKILRKEGVCSLYKGLTPFCIWNISRVSTALLIFKLLGISGVEVSTSISM
ncbi:hypothetical protein RND81_06G111600 [Saponaria officinalis]|uniref:ADP/ATP translocase n=1 Tax=Saponaria officinalis TaxID=3572 RepID=A0AAW1K8T3_SAPOF